MYYKIAEWIVEYSPRYEKLRKKMVPYELELNEKREDFVPDISLKYNEAYHNEQHKLYPSVADDRLEYIYAGGQFNRKILDYGGIMIHASAVAVDGKAYLFSAPCGTGKSTHTKQWQKYFGAERAVIINDDKPVLYRNSDGWYAYGTPFSGKTDENMNRKVRLQGICMLERGENQIRRIEPAEAIMLILQQTIRPKDEKYLEEMLKIMDRILTEVPVYRMQCDISEEAVKMAYENMRQ